MILFGPYLDDLPFQPIKALHFQFRICNNTTPKTIKKRHSRTSCFITFLFLDQSPYSDLVESSHRIDERALRHLIPIVKIETLRERCGAWFGVAFLARQIICSGNMFDRLASFEGREWYATIHSTFDTPQNDNQIQHQNALFYTF